MNYFYILFIIFVLLFLYVFWKWKNRAILITHSGGYHSDDIFATAILIIFLKKKGKWFKIIRTRDEKILEKWRQEREKGREVFIYDIGHRYDEEKNEFDHHQIGGAKTRENGIEYSSAGLVWDKFGEKIAGGKDWKRSLEKKLFMSIDALDNGQKVCDYRYDCFVYDIGNLFKKFLPEKKTHKNIMKSFLKSVRLAKFILEKEIENYKRLELEAEKLDEIYNSAEDKRVLIFDDKGVSLNLIVEKHPEVMFMISKKDKNVWVIETIPTNFGSFDRRKYFPKEWGGLNDLELDKVTGLNGGIFCHRNVFIASANNLETAKAMVEKSLSE